jgi:Uma2 family endonuclease
MLNWQQACEATYLRDLPCKIELTPQGQILMSPVKIYHSALQGKIAALLYLHLEQQGQVLSACAIQTRLGIKVADVAWVSASRFAEIKTQTACSVAPEICVEVLSDSNTEAEMQQKRQLYFAQGAQEVWICDETGHIAFYSETACLSHSQRLPSFPVHL